MAASLTRDESVLGAFAEDASGLRLVPEALARPTSPEEVVELMREASADRTPVTPAGGQSSTTGASITDRGILLSLARMTRIFDIDADRRVVRAQAGAILGDV